MKMKTLNHIMAVLGISLCLPLLNACDDAENKPITDALYISESGTTANKLTINDESGADGTITVKSASPAEKDIKVVLGVSAQALESYNTKHGTNLVALPEDMFTLSKSEVTIKAGAVTSEMVDVHIKPFSEEMQNSGINYALPISILSASEPEFVILDAKKTAVYACDFVIKTKATRFSIYNYAQSTMRQDYDLANWSVEMRVKIDEAGSGKNNQTFFLASGNTGSEGDGFIFGRFEGDILQFKVNGHNGFNGNKFTPKGKTWYHIALVCENGTLYLYINGTLNNTLSDSKFRTVAHLAKDGFQFPVLQDWSVAHRTSALTMHEVRFWTKAITATQIKDNMFSVDPQSDGLEAYWKMNEGEGTVLNDATGHNNIMTIKMKEGYESQSDVTWVNVRSDDPDTEN